MTLKGLGDCKTRGLKIHGTPTHQMPHVASLAATKRHMAFSFSRHFLWHPELRHFNTRRLQQLQRDDTRVRVGLRQVEAEVQEDWLQLWRKTRDVYFSLAALDLSASSLKTL